MAQRECLPGGTCSVCNDPTPTCRECGRPLDDDGCPKCDAIPECEWCGGGIDEGHKFCSRDCARAAESDHA